MFWLRPVDCAQHVTAHVSAISRKRGRSEESEWQPRAHTSADGPIGAAGARRRRWRRASRGNEARRRNSGRRGALYLSRPRIRWPRYVASERGVPRRTKINISVASRGRESGAAGRHLPCYYSRALPRRRTFSRADGVTTTEPLGRCRRRHRSVAPRRVAECLREELT